MHATANSLASVAPHLVQTGGAAEVDVSRRAFELGWDFAGYAGLQLPEDAGAEMHQGWKEGRRRLKPVHADRYVRKWLSLRHNALRRGRVVDSSVTPELLRQIEPAMCPIVLEPMTVATGGDMDWSVDRVINQGAYALANVAIISVRANRAKGSLDMNGVLDITCRLFGTDERHLGLGWREWARLAAVMTGPHRLATGEMLVLPQCTQTPPGLAINPPQVLQSAIATEALGLSKHHVLARIRETGGAAAHRPLHRLVQAIRHKGIRNRWAFDVWLEPGVFDRFLEWFEKVEMRLPALYRAVVENDGLRRSWINPDKVRSAWSLDTHGYAHDARQLEAA